MTSSRLLLLPLLLGIAPGAWAQSNHRTSPILCHLQARYPRNPKHYPAHERLAAFRFYWIRDLTGKKVGDLAPLGPGTWPTFRVVGSDGSSLGSLHLTRPQRNGFVVRNEHLIRIGRIVRMPAQAGEYEWRNQEDEAIGTLIPVNGSLYYEVRGGDALRALLVDRWKIALPDPTALDAAVEARPSEDPGGGGRAARARRRFQLLHRAAEE